MKIWTVWIQDKDGFTWIEDAWDDPSTADNHDGWVEAVDKAKGVAKDNFGTHRVIALNVPDEQILNAFRCPEVEASVE